MPPRILSVDDSKTIRTIIRKALSSLNCELIEAEDGLEGLEKAREFYPDLILLDIDMPRMNGLEMLINLRSDDRTRTIPVFMLTSKSKEKNVRIAFKLGVKAFIGKPFKRDELIEKIRNEVALSPQ